MPCFENQVFLNKYTFIRDRDILAIMFPKRWPIMSWSSWNLAKAEGRVQLISLGPVSHNGPNGPIDAISQLPNGQTHLSQTLEIVMNILGAQVLLKAQR
jgi:hypothetical protein